MKQYRKVKFDETLQEGDEYLGEGGVWYKTVCVGAKPFILEYRRQVEEDNTFFVFSDKPLNFDNMEASE
jgi:hypothetical protein